MSFVPLTFGMGLENQGVEQGMNKTLKVLKGINAVIGESGTLAANAMKPFRTMGKVLTAPFKALGGALGMAEQRIGQFNLASIASDMKALTGQTGNLSDEMDAAFASSAKTVRPLLASVGKSGAELRKLTGQAASMAYSMNVGADTVGKVMAELASAGGPAKKGLDALNMSTKDFVKFVEVSGVETKDLGGVLGGLQASWNLTAAEAAHTADAMLAYGQAVGVGTQGLAQFKPLIDKVDAAMGGLPPNLQLNAQEMQTLAVSSVKLAGAYREMGAGSEQAMEYAQGTAEMFTKEYVAFQKAQLGLGDYGEVTKSLMSTLGGLGMSWEDFGQLLKVGATDSSKGVMQLQATVQSLANQNNLPSANVLMGDLLGKVGETSPAMAWLAQNVTNGEAALKKFSGMTVDSAGALKKLAREGFSSGFTLQESFDMARKGMEHMVRGIAGKETMSYVKTQVKAFRLVGQEVKGLGADKKWGPLVKKLALLKRTGVQGLVMSMAGGKKGQMEVGKTFAKMELLGGAIESVSDAAAPLMATLGKFGPLGTIAGGLATWFTIPEASRDEIIKTLDPIFQDIKQKAGEIWYGTGGEDKGLKAFLLSGLNSAIEAVKPLVKGFLGGLIDDGLSFVGNVFETNLVDPIKRGIDFALESVGFLKDSVSSIFEGMWIQMKIGFYGAFSGILGSLASIPGMGKVMKMMGFDFAAFRQSAKTEIESLQKEMAVVRATPMLTGVLRMEKVYGKGSLVKAPSAPAGATQAQQPYYTPGMGADMTQAPAVQTPAAQTANVLNNMGMRIKESTLPMDASMLGTQTMTSLSTGIADNQSYVFGSLDAVLQEVALNLQSNSPPVTGPLSGTETDNPAYNGGYGLMMNMATGITDGATWVQTALEGALLTSFDAAWGVYEGHAAEKINTSRVMAAVADRLVRELGATAQIDLTAQEERILKTSVDVPGMAGVTGAIIADGALTRKVLNRIADATEGTYNLFKNTKPGKPGGIALGTGG